MGHSYQRKLREREREGDGVGRVSADRWVQRVSEREREKEGEGSGFTGRFGGLGQH